MSLKATVGNQVENFCSPQQCPAGQEIGLFDPCTLLLSFLDFLQNPSASGRTGSWEEGSSFHAKHPWVPFQPRV